MNVYIIFTIERKLILRIGTRCAINTYVDSSFGLYADGKSVTGLIIMIGEAPIFFETSKQKIITRLSTESELVGISDSLSQNLTCLLLSLVDLPFLARYIAL